MKFLCVGCDEPMRLSDNEASGEGNLRLVFHCPRCDHDVAMLTNSGETQVVQAMGVQIGSNDVPAPRFTALRSHMTNMREDAFSENDAIEPGWTRAALQRLAKHPTFIQPVIRKTYTDFAQRNGIGEVDLEVMDAARRELEKE